MIDSWKKKGGQLSRVKKCHMARGMGTRAAKAWQRVIERKRSWVYCAGNKLGWQRGTKKGSATGRRCLAVKRIGWRLNWVWPIRASRKCARGCLS